MGVHSRGGWGGYIGPIHIDKGPDSEKRPGGKPIEIWQRFPKFIPDFILVFAVSMWLAAAPRRRSQRRCAAAGEANIFRVIFSS